VTFTLFVLAVYAYGLLSGVLLAASVSAYVNPHQGRHRARRR
jgi:hypothetical protein